MTIFALIRTSPPSLLAKRLNPTSTGKHKVLHLKSPLHDTGTGPKIKEKCFRSLPKTPSEAHARKGPIPASIFLHFRSPKPSQNRSKTAPKNHPGTEALKAPRKIAQNRFWNQKIRNLGPKTVPNLIRAARWEPPFEPKCTPERCPKTSGKRLAQNKISGAILG